MPGTTVVTPSVLVIAKSACVSVSVSLELSLPGTVSVTPAGGLTVAVLVSGLVRAGSMASVSMKLVVPPVARVPVMKLTVLVTES